MKRSFVLLLAILIALAAVPSNIGNACSRMYAFRLGELVNADVIVRATAVKYIVDPDPNLRTTGVPGSTVEFKVEEKIRGADVPDNIVLNAYLSDRDDFNEVPLPYRFVRMDGRAGSCFANTYKQGAQFLLFLKKSKDGYTPNFSPLGPTNEQLRGPDDPWLKWVKAYLSPCARHAGQEMDYAESSKTELEVWLNKPQTDLERYRISKCYLTKYGGADSDAARYVDVVNFYETIPARK